MLKIVKFVESGQENVEYYINVGYVTKKRWFRCKLLRLEKKMLKIVEMLDMLQKMFESEKW